jgi:flavin reductase (DIM6/NTAB) family NADH-FMN oxidoreductase RutF
VDIVAELAHLQRTAVDPVDVATHTVFVARVRDVRVRAGEPLAYLRGAFGRFERPA